MAHAEALSSHPAPMRKKLTTILLALLALLSVTAAVFLSIDGSLARLTGWYHFRPGMSLFPEENLKRLKHVSWMRIRDLHDTIECERADDGTWWICHPFRDRMAPSAAQLILSFTAQAHLVDTLPLNRTTRTSLREFGVETSPHTITLKVPTGDGDDMTTVARYTLGSASPWLADAEDGEHVLPTTYLRTDFYGRDKRIHVVSGNILSIFRNGLQGLRDPRPLSLDADSLLSLSIQKAGSQPLLISRMSAQSPWNISRPTLCEANQEQVDALIDKLSRLKAIRIDDAAAVSLPQEPVVSLLLSYDSGASAKLCFYEPFSSPSDGQKICYATVSDRPVVFTLAVEPKLKRGGSYATIVKNVLSMPVLPAATLARLQASMDSVYTSELPLQLSELRSQHFSNIEMRDIDKVFMRSRYAPYPVRLLRIPGDAESQVEDVWMYSAGGRKYSEADTEVVTQFLNSMSSIPVTGFVKDIGPDDDAESEIRKYGLNRPDYTLVLQPRECAARAVLYGIDMPLVKDRAPRTFFIKRQRDEKESYWVGMEQNTSSIYRLSPKMTRLFSFFPEAWKKRSLVEFPISALRSLTLNFQQVPLVLHYDYIGESWTGELGEEDITPRINPHRTNYYVRHLQRIRVMQWLSPDDEDALAALQQPLFSVKLDLELTDYSDVDQLVLNQKEEDIDAESGSRMDMVQKMLSESDDETDLAFRKMAMGEKKTEKKTLTLEIAISDTRAKKPFFYGRIRETGELFILSYDDAQSLGGRLLD